LRESDHCDASFSKPSGPQDEDDTTVTAFLWSAIEIAGQGVMSSEEMASVASPGNRLHRPCACRLVAMHQLVEWRVFTPSFV